MNINKNKKIIIYIVLSILVLITIFYAGMSYGKNKNNISQDTKGLQNRFSQFGMMGGKNQLGLNREGLINGEIISKDTTSITVKIFDGGSKIIFLNTNTNISKMTTGTVNDLINNTQVSITGTTNPDGSISAKNIQIRPQIKQKTSAQ